MLKQPKTYRSKAIAVAVALACSPFAANAAGLGRITVNSALGYPLRAELEVMASSDETNSMTARLAPADAFRAAGIEYVPALSALHFSKEIVERDGKRYIQITTDRPLNEPFVDMLVELSWASGRLVREFTFLLDPPATTMKTPPMAVMPPEVKVQAVPAASARQPTNVPMAKPQAPVVPSGGSAAAPAAKRGSAATSGTRAVKPGETLRGIAAETMHAGVSLDQMLVALFRSNTSAFDGNMNRMRAGKILSIPDAESARSLSQVDAHREVVAQAADFNAYRRKLAETAAGQPDAGSAAGRASSGRIAPRVAAEPPAATQKDKLEVSRSDVAGAGKGGVSPQLQGRLAALEEDLVARDRALREANSRIAQLEKNLADLKKLAEMKSEGGAALQKQAEAAKPASPPPATPTAPAAPAPASPPAVAPAAPEPAPAAAVAAADAPKPPDAPKAVAPEAAPQPKPPKKQFVPPPPPPEPDFLEENGTLVFGGAGLLAAALGYLGFSAYRRKKAASAEDDVEIRQEDLSRGSVFSQTANASVAQPEDAASEFSISETSPETSAAAVDPLVEAETYLAFGRDSQAEEILLDALKADPTRLPVQLKLLDIYSARRSPMQFNTLAMELKSQTGGSGPDWARVAAMGAALDPNNSLYQDVFQGDATVQIPMPGTEPVDLEKTMVFSTLPEVAEPPPATEAPPSAEPTQPEEVAALDFDLDLGKTMAVPLAPAEPAVDVAAVEPEPEAPTSPDDLAMGLDFDLGLDSVPAAAEIAAPEAALVAAPTAEAAAADAESRNETELLDIDFDLGDGGATQTSEALVAESGADVGLEAPMLDLDLGSDEAPAVSAETSPSVSQEAADGSVDFSLDLELPSVAATEQAGSAASAAAEQDITSSGIDFDFDLGETVTAAAPAAAETPAVPQMPGLDLDLDLDLPDASGESNVVISLDSTAVEEQAPGSMPEDAGGDNPEAATKLELALAYEEMGDRDGARELLEEVLNEGSTAQRDAARERLDALG